MCSCCLALTISITNSFAFARIVIEGTGSHAHHQVSCFHPVTGSPAYGASIPSLRSTEKSSFIGGSSGATATCTRSRKLVVSALNLPQPHKTIQQTFRCVPELICTAHLSCDSLGWSRRRRAEAAELSLDGIVTLERAHALLQMRLPPARQHAYHA